MKSLFISILLLPMIALATTLSLSGTLATNLIPSHDTVLFTANTTIAKGVSLTINAGRVVRFANNAGLTVYGALRILGTANDSVKVEPSSGNWLGISIPGGTYMNGDSIIIQYASIRGSNYVALQVRDYNLLRVTNTRFYQNRNTSVSTNAYSGSAIYAERSNLKLENCLFEDNSDLSTSGQGGAIHWYQGVGTIRNCTFQRDTAKFGGAIYAQLVDTLNIIGCRFRGNQLAIGPTGYGGSVYSKESRLYIRKSNFYFDTTAATSMNYHHGIALYDTLGKVMHLSEDTLSGYRGLSPRSPITVYTDSMYVANSLFYNNKVSPSTKLSGGALYFNGRTVQITGILAHHNTADNGGFAFLRFTEDARVSQSTIANNTAKTLYPGIYASTSLNRGAYLFGTLVWGNTPSVDQTMGYGALNVIQGVDGATLYPEFVDSAQGNFRLSSLSPYIDGGYAIAFNILTTDLDGNPRTVHWSPDVGAYEYQGARPSNFAGVISRDTVVPAGNYTVKNQCLRVLDGATMTISAGTTLEFDNTCFVVYGELKVAGTQAKPVAFTSKAALGWDGLMIKDLSWYEQASGTDSSSVRYLNISKSKGNLVTQESYSKISFSHSNFVAGDGVGAINTAGLSRTTIDSSTFSGSGGGIEGGSYLRSKGNSALGPGLAFHFGDSSVVDSWTFDHCAVTLGVNGFILMRNSILNASPVTVSGSAKMVNVLAYGGDAQTPAIKVDFGGLGLLHSTIVDNGNYAVVAASGSVDIRNSVIWNNFGGDGVPQLNTTYGSIAVENTLIQNGWLGTGNLTESPKFAAASSQDYSLLTDSPALDKGDSTGMIQWMDGYDLAGNPRFCGDAMELGAYEFDCGDPQDIWHLQGTVPIIVRESTRKVLPNVQLRKRFDLLGRSL